MSSDAIDDFIALPQDQQMSTLQQLAPDKQDQLLGQVKQRKAASVAATSTQPAPGFMQRFGEATGIPTTQAAGEATQPSLLEAAGGPAFTAGHILYNYGKNIVDESKKAYQGVKEAGQNIAAGQPIVPNIGKAQSHMQEFMLRGPLAPVGGGAVQSGGEDFEQGNYPAFAGDALGSLANLLLLKHASGPSDATATNKLAYAAGKGTTADIARSLADIKNAAKAGPTNTVDDFLSTVNRAKANLSNEAGAAMAPIAQRSTIPIGISDKIRDLITPNLAQTPDGLAEIQKIKEAAKDFEKPWTYEQLDAERGTINKKLNNFYKKGVADQYAATGNRTIAIDKTIADAIRDKLYPEMDQQAGQPTGYFRDLKQRHGALINLQDALTDRVEDLKDQTARIQGGPRLTDEQAAAGATGHAGVARTALRAVHQPNPLKVANRRIPASLATGNPLAKAAVGTLPARYLLAMPDADQPTLPAGHPLAASQPTQ